MSKHWKPDGEIVRVRPVRGRRLRSLDEFERPAWLSRRPWAKKRWPEGATVGLVLIAAVCVGTAVGLYLAAAPRDVFAP